jgi:hypothetical protein
MWSIRTVGRRSSSSKVFWKLAVMLASSCSHRSSTIIGTDTEYQLTGGGDNLCGEPHETVLILCVAAVHDVGALENRVRLSELELWIFSPEPVFTNKY